MSPVLVTGATGKTGTALLEALSSRGVTARAGSRSAFGQDPGTVRFDWEDSATQEAALDGVDRVYLVPPPSALDPLPTVGPFLGRAQRAGVRRLVLLSSAVVFPGAPGRLELAAQVREQPGWVVLRPSGFMQNFLPPHPLGRGIRARGEIKTSAGDRRPGWIDVQDVAEVAAALLSDPDVGALDDYRLTGPEALSYPEAAAAITARSGRPVRVQHLDIDGLTAYYRDAGLPSSFAASLAAAETATGAGGDEVLTTSVLELTGRQPGTFDAFVRRNAGEWPDPGTDDR